MSSEPARSVAEEPLDDAEPAEEDPEAGTSRFGAPGRPLNRRSPFLFGFLFGLGVIVAYALFLGVRNAASILVLIFIALFLAIGLNPAVAIVSLSVVALLAGGLVALIPPLVTQTTELINNAPETIENLRRSETINELVQRYDIVNKVQSAVNAGTIGGALGGVVGGAKLIFGTIFNVLTVLVLTIYFMASFERLKEAGFSLVPSSRRDRVRLLTDEILTKVGGYMVGAIAIAVLAGLSTFVMAVLLDLPYPFALAVVVAVCDLIPQIGATIGAVIVSLVGLASSVADGVVCIAFFLIYQQIENYLIYPRVMRRSVQVSDVAAVVAALLGVALFGVVGALVAIPLVAAVQLIMREVLVPSMDQR
ncbi:AI-2E family transporter [Actinoplanes regularis]|uniref:AI-2E family transporter n=1 Tax=Actinoplanes regularis TaxID=52697 RepID=UPI0024A56339|nr:AI-2E family transporter [Actinoplanes regularis]GLW28999.1 AI-2E family transporter [Actinoplanes regularis]